VCDLSDGSIFNGLNDPRFQGHKFTVDAIDVLWAQLTRDLFAIVVILY